MAPPPPWVDKLLEVLADGQWHVLDDVITAAAVSVPPGVAYRAGERLRTGCRAGPAKRVRGDETTSITKGARVKIKEAVWPRVYNGSIDRRVSRNGVVRIRLNRRALKKRAAA